MITITFTLEYKTRWSEEVCITGSIPELGDNNIDNSLILSTNDGIKWYGTIEIPHSSNIKIQYFYSIKRNNLLIRKEATPRHTLLINNEHKNIVINDRWINKHPHHYLFSSVFKNSIFKRSKELLEPTKYKRSIILHVICPFVQKDEHLVITGDNEALGNWDLSKALHLRSVKLGEWHIELDANNYKNDFEYKLVIVKKRDNSVIHWEDGENRKFFINQSTNLMDPFCYYESGINFGYSSFRWKGVGTSLPLFSIRTERSCGIGEFLDLKDLADWIVTTNQQIIQILPINDTRSTNTWRDSYPYNSISIFALNPIYISLNEFSLQDKAKQNKYNIQSKYLNDLEIVDYEGVSRLKYSYLRDLFIEQSERTFNSEEYKIFYNSNSSWLFPYICFCYLRDKFKTAEFEKWGDYSVYLKSKLYELIETNEEAQKETKFYAYLQYIAHNQLISAKNYCNRKGVSVKGDIPIGINRNSVEAWTEPHLFNMQMQTGAPPDDFSLLGQNWGFPTYNWEEMELNDFEWWRQRFSKMSDYFDAYRIDHILGFFRIWEIPLNHIQGLLGHFNPALPLSETELLGMDFPFNKDRMLKPHINQTVLELLFGDLKDEVIEHYLNVLPEDNFQLKPQYDTQKKIAQYFLHKNDSKNVRLGDGLLRLCSEVLFVSDPYKDGYYHPRISAQGTYSYKFLDENLKDLYNQIYIDFFYKRHNSFWYKQAMSKLPHLISSTSMMACGEDLGMVPECVERVMTELKILSLELERMPKQLDVLFADLDKLPYLSVNTTSTHDMSTIRGWWKELSMSNRKYYYNHILKCEGEAPMRCSASISEKIIRRHLYSNSLWTILPLQDWLSISEKIRLPNEDNERINDPSNPNQYWQYRMHLPIEKLLEEDELNERIRKMI